MPGKVEKEYQKLYIARILYNFTPREDGDPWEWYQVGTLCETPLGGGLVSCLKIQKHPRESLCYKVYLDDGSIIHQYNINQVFWAPIPKEEDEQTGETDDGDGLDKRD